MIITAIMGNDACVGLPNHYQENLGEDVNDLNDGVNPSTSDGAAQAFSVQVANTLPINKSGQIPIV